MELYALKRHISTSSRSLEEKESTPGDKKHSSRAELVNRNMKRREAEGFVLVLYFVSTCLRQDKLAGCRYFYATCQ